MTSESSYSAILAILLALFLSTFEMKLSCKEIQLYWFDVV